MSNLIFANGIYLQKKTEKTPDFIKIRLSFKSKDFVAFLKEHTNENGYCNIDLRESKDGKRYFALNDWKKDDTKSDGKDDEGYEKSQTTTEDKDINVEEIPF